jgi:hypothetical protein
MTIGILDASLATESRIQTEEKPKRCGPDGWHPNSPVVVVLTHYKTPEKYSRDAITTDTVLFQNLYTARMGDRASPAEQGFRPTNANLRNGGYGRGFCNASVSRIIRA